MWSTSPKSVLAAVAISVPSKFISTPSPRSITGSADAVRSSADAVRSSESYAGAPGKSIGAGASLELAVPSLAEAGKRGVRSALLTEDTTASEDPKLAAGCLCEMLCDAAQPAKIKICNKAVLVRA
jgi:hypothetical protein